MCVPPERTGGFAKRAFLDWPKEKQVCIDICEKKQLEEPRTPKDQKDVYASELKRICY